ncbi:MAG: hypothetical protein KDA75_16250 [Planctomycetaceae bacterium]|nr:hypothetical protein [Planctomycetaceae bacterium]
MHVKTLAVCGFLLGAVSVFAEGPLGGFPPEVEPQIAEPGEVLEQPLSARVYTVADLVVQPGSTSGGASVTIEASPVPSVTPASVVTAQQAALENLAELSVILQSVVAPDSWEMSGGQGRVTAHGRTLSLIVRQTDSGHDEIGHLLDELRRAAATEIEVTIQIYGESQTETPPPDDLAATDDGRPSVIFADVLKHLSGPLDAEQAAELRSALRQGSSTILRQTFLLQNGQGESAGALLGAGLLRCSAVMSADRRSIRFDAGLLTDAPENGEIYFRGRIFEGQTVAIPFTLTTDRVPLLAIIDARVRTPEELPELRLVEPLPVTQHTQSSPAAVIQRTSHEIAVEQPDAARSVVYPVADLLPGVLVSSEASPEGRQFEFDRWAADIGRSIGRSLWTPGTSIATHAGTLSLVVRQTGEGHRRVSEHLSRLRVARDGVTEISVTPLPRGAPKTHATNTPLSPEQVKQILSGTKSDSVRLRMTVHNSPQPTAKVAPGVWLSIVPSITEDRLFVEQVTVDSESLQQTVVAHWTVPVGQSILLAGAATEDEPPVLVTFERTTTQEEKEQLLGIPGN